MKQAELNISKAIVEYLNYQGCAVWLNEICGMPSKHSPTGRRKLRGGRGSADICGTLRGGRACYIETKTEKDRKRITEIWNYYEGNNRWPIEKYKLDYHILEQCEFLMWQRKAGAFVMFAFSADDVINIIDEVLS